MAVPLRNHAYVSGLEFFAFFLFFLFFFKHEFFISIDFR